MSNRTEVNNARKFLGSIRIKGAWILVMLLSLCLLPSAIKAQVLYGSVTGNVTDQTGAVVPSASVDLLNTGTGVSTHTVTNDRGVFLVSDVMPGTYKVTIAAPNMGTIVREGVKVDPNGVFRLDTQLNVAQASQTITVTGAPAELQTDRADVHVDIDKALVGNLPLNSSEGRNFQILYKTIPGFSTPSEQNSAAGNPQRSMTSSVNGISQSNNSTKIDGATDLYPWLPANIAYVPPADSIEEVNIVTDAFDAEQGMAGGAAVNLTIKSGTNNIHGGAFWSFSNNHMRALNAFAPANFVNPKNINNEFGGNVGGPILKKKLFYFVDFEGTRQRQFAFKNLLIPNASIRPDANGNVNFTGTGTTIFDPATGSSTGTGRTAFAGDIIPANRINPAALKYLALLPGTNQTGNSSFDYTNTASAQYNRNDVDAKITYVPTSKSTLFGRYSISDGSIFDPPALGSGGGDATNGGQNGQAGFRIQNIGIGGTYAFSPTLLLDGNFGYTRQRLDAFNVDLNTNVGLTTLGIPGTNGDTFLEGGIPAFFVTGFANMGDPNTGNPFLFRDNQYVNGLNMSWKHGNHSIRFGMERTHWGINHFQPQGGTFQTARGSFNFTGNLTALNGGSSPTMYNAWADFLLGLPSSSGKALELTNPNTERESDWGAYIRDQWQINSKLTFNIGVRWEYYPFLTRDHEGASYFDPITGNVFIGGLGALPIGDNIKTGPGQFLPRAGLAYRLDSKTVIRLGFGISADPNNFRNLRDAYPGDIISNFPGVVTGTGASFSPSGILSLPTGATGTTFTVGPYTVPVGLPAAVLPNLGKGVVLLPNNLSTATVPQNYNRGYIESSNLTVERELGAGFVAQVAYVGVLAIRQEAQVNINAASPGGGTAGQALNAKFGTSLFGTQTTWGSINSLLPCCSSHYNALQSRLTRRMGKFGTINAAYTFSKAIDFADNSDSGLFFLDPANMFRNRALAGFDQTHNLEIFGVQPSPFGKGQPWINQGWGAKILGGWQLDEVMTRTSGMPFTVTASGASLNAPGNSQTANQILPNVAILGGIGPGNPYFNTAAFAPVTTVAFGTAGRNILRGPGIFNLDIAIDRTFSITERLKLQLRAEAFGVTNTPHYANPNANISAANFGIVTSTLGSTGSGASSVRDGSRQIWATAKIIF